MKRKIQTIRNPKRNPIRNRLYKNRVKATIASEIGEITLSFGFKSKNQAEDLFNVLMDCEHCCGASLFQDGKFMGGRDGKAS